MESLTLDRPTPTPPLGRGTDPRPKVELPQPGRSVRIGDVLVVATGVRTRGEPDGVFYEIRPLTRGA